MTMTASCRHTSPPSLLLPFSFTRLPYTYPYPQLPKDLADRAWSVSTKAVKQCTPLLIYWARKPIYSMI